MSNRLFYQAEGARCGDVIPKYIDGRYQLFYLKGWKDREREDYVPGWHRMESKDLLHMGAEVPIHVLGGTGDLYYHEGTWHLFACIFPDGKQLITHYISADGTLDHWIHQEEDTFGPDGVIYHCSDWRDPRIVWNEENQEFLMYLAARKNEAHSQTGCVGLCASKDLSHWEYREPAYYPKRFNGACECPDIFTMGDWEYLIFSSYTTLFGNYYVKREKGSKIWQIPKNHRLDSRAFYAAKTAGTESERCLFGWNPVKEENIFGFWPDRFETIDYRTWDWGGSMVIHELVQQEDGDLGLRFPGSKKKFFGKKVPMEVLAYTDGAVKVENGYSLGASGTQDMVVLSAASEAEDRQDTVVLTEAPEVFRFSVDVNCRDAVQAGVILRVDESMGKGYYLYLEPERKRLVYRSWLRMYEEGGKTFPYDTEMEVPVRERKDGIYHMEIVAEGTAATCYVNDEAALSFRMYDLTGGQIGIFSFGKAVFSNLSLEVLEE